MVGEHAYNPIPPPSHTVEMSLLVKSVDFLPVKNFPMLLQPFRQRPANHIMSIDSKSIYSPFQRSLTETLIRSVGYVDEDLANKLDHLGRVYTKICVTYGVYFSLTQSFIAYRRPSMALPFNSV